jgi:hypothetical protein
MPFLFGQPQFLLKALFDELQDVPISVITINRNKIFVFSFFMDVDP